MGIVETATQAIFRDWVITWVPMPSTLPPPALFSSSAKKAAQPQLQGEFIRGLDINQSVKVAIPVLDGIKQADSRDNGNRKRKNDFQQHSHVGGSVYFGGFFQAFRKLPEKRSSLQ